MKTLMAIPCFNCQKQIKRVINKIAADQILNDYIDLILFVENKSDDNTLEQIIESRESLSIPSTILANEENYGLGGSFKIIVKYAHENGFDSLVFMHGDDQASPQDIAPMIIEFQKEKYDCIFGSRFMKKSVLTGYSKKREHANRFLNFVFSIFLMNKIEELGSGLNIYRVRSLPIEEIEFWPSHIAFDIYLLLHFFSKEKLYKVKFFPIQWNEKDQISNANNFNVTIRILQILLLNCFVRKTLLEKTSVMKNKQIE